MVDTYLLTPEEEDEKITRGQEQIVYRAAQRRCFGVGSSTLRCFGLGGARTKIPRQPVRKAYCQHLSVSATRLHMIEKLGAYWLAGGWIRDSIRHRLRSKSRWSADEMQRLLHRYWKAAARICPKAATRGQITAHDALHMQWSRRIDQMPRYEASANLDAALGDSFLLLSLFLPLLLPSRPMAPLA